MILDLYTFLALKDPGCSPSSFDVPFPFKQYWKNTHAHEAGADALGSLSGTADQAISTDTYLHNPPWRRGKMSWIHTLIYLEHTDPDRLSGNYSGKQQVSMSTSARGFIQMLPTACNAIFQEIYQHQCRD